MSTSLILISRHDTSRHLSSAHLISTGHLLDPTHIILPLALATVHNIFFLRRTSISFSTLLLDPTRIISRSDAHHLSIRRTSSSHHLTTRRTSFPRPINLGSSSSAAHRYHSPPSKISLLNNHLHNNHLLNKHLLNSQRGYWQSDNQMEEEPNNKKQNNQQSNGN
jgi:hypothetical protein